MATKNFAIRTEPHIAEIGDVKLLFVPEANGSELLDGHARLKEEQSSIDLETDPMAAHKVLRALRVFLAQFMLPESAELFTTLDVVNADGVRVQSFKDEMEARDFAATMGAGAKAVDRLPLPQWVLTELLEWVVETLAGGTRPTGSATGS